jgi:hypothetical protein
MSEKRGGRVIALLPPSDETQKRRKDVRIDLTLAYTLLGHDVTFVGTFFKASAEDARRSEEYVSQTLPRVLEGWKAGEGAPHFKAQRLRHLEGGLERTSPHSLKLASRLYLTSFYQGSMRVLRSCPREATRARNSCIRSSNLKQCSISSCTTLYISIRISTPHSAPFPAPSFARPRRPMHVALK